MNISAMYHDPKSQFAYPYNNTELHIRFRTANSDIDHIEILAADPFDWVNTKDGEHYFNYSSVKRIQMIKDYSDELFDYWFAKIDGFIHLRIRYIFILHKEESKLVYGAEKREQYSSDIEKFEDFRNFYNFPFINEEDVFKAPDWVRDTVWYQIFPERFANSNNVSDKFLPWDSVKQIKLNMFFGGNLQGVIDHLDYIQDLGINGIYFTPIFDSPSSHKYNTTDYFNIDPSFGDNKIFRNLVQEAHKRGIKVMLDAVFNHCGYLHPYWQDVLNLGKQSKYYDWFHILDEPRSLSVDENGMPHGITEQERKSLFYRTFGFVPAMPKWNTANKDTREYLISIGKFWVQEFNIDGWRLDVSNEVSHYFWRDFRKAMKEINEDIYILGENWDSSYPWLMGDQFDATMNYSFTNIVWDTLGNAENKLSSLSCRDRLSKLLVSYPKNVMPNMFNIIDSHDTSRIMSLCDNNVHKVKLSFLLLLTFAGSPSIYYGSEIGLCGLGDNNRQCMPWDESKHNMDLKEHVKKLVKIRRTLEAAKSVDMKFLSSKENNEFICFEKTSNNEYLYVLINNTDSDLNVGLPEELSNSSFFDIYNDVDVKTSKDINIKAYGFYILIK